MRKLLSIGMTLFFIIVLSSCSPSSQNVNHDEMPEILEVDLHVPEKGDVGETIIASAYVTQGKEEVNDADEVIFEVWVEGQKEESKMLDFTSQEEGTYHLETSFDEEGVYYIQVHVTARGMHVMPTKQIIIGDTQS